MKIVTLLAQKGGTGKTTLSIHLAVVAAGNDLKTIIADTDPQGSAMVWRKRRPKNNPAVLQFSAGDLAGDIEALKEAGAELLIIDTAPHSSSEAQAAAGLADFILIPSRPAIFDLAAIGDSVAIVRQSGVPGAVVLNCCPPPRRRGETAIVIEARQALEVYGLPIAPPAVTQRAAFSHALIDGRAVTEFEKNGKAADEIRRLWDWTVKELQG